MGGVVEAVVDAAIGWLVQSILGSLFTEQIQAWARDVGLAEDVENLKSEMRDVEMVLAAAEGRRIENKPLVRSLHDLKELLYDAEDVMDELDYYRLQQQIEQGEGCTDSEESSVASSTPSLQLACTSTASRIVGWCRGDRKRKREEEPTYSTISERIRGIVDHLGKLRSSVREVLQLEISQPITMANQSQSAVKNKRLTTSIPIEDKVYGRDAERDKIVELLINGKSSDLQVLPIVGIGGIGKTTLARFVYSHQRIKEHFDLQMWVCVSTNFDTVRLTREILEHVCTDRQQFEKITNFNVLQDILLKNLENKRFLLVFDDMWEERDRRGWFSLLAPLKHNHVPGCMILATTRWPSVAKMIETMDSVSVEGLDEKEFWLFFKACAFGNESHQGHPSLQSIGQHIVKALKGCPLAARSVGALLNKDITYEHWRTVQNKWKSLQEDTDHILPILKLSYDFLPVRLQQCFSYCSLFPEDYRFNWENLVHAWISQNFVQCEDPSKRLEETGKEYLDNLVDFGFFQKVDSDYVLHDLMHELAQMVSLNELTLEKLVLIKMPILERCSELTGPLFSSSQEGHKVCLSSLGSLIICDCPRLMVPFPVPPFGHIRKLFIKNGKLSIDMDGTELDVESNELNVLDGQILAFHNLRDLTSLNIRNCPKLVSISSEGFSQLTSLVYLEISKCQNLLKPPITLEAALENSSSGNTPALPSLRHLDISSSGIAGGWLTKMLPHVRSLQELHLRDCPQIKSLWISEPTEMEESSSLASAAVLSAEDQTLLKVPSNILCSLKGLTISRCVDLELYSGNGGFVGFTSLEVLQIHGCPKLGLSLVSSMKDDDTRNVDVGLLPPCLKSLRISGCPNLVLLLVRETKDGTSNMDVGLLPSSLETLSLSHIPENLPSYFLKGLAYLKKLRLTDSPWLKCVQLHSCTALEELEIWRCEQLGVLEGLQFLTTLNSLVIEMNPKLSAAWCQDPKLQEQEQRGNRIGLLPRSIDYLVISNLTNNVQSRLLPCLPAMNSLVCTKSPELKCLQLGYCTALTKLEIRDCESLASIEGFQSITNLKYFTVAALSSLLAWMELLLQQQGVCEVLSRLTRLVIGDASVLTMSLCQQLTSLQCLELNGRGTSPMVSLTEEQERALQLLTSLQWLGFFDYPNLLSLPANLRCLVSLQCLSITSCPSISELPEMAPSCRLYVSNCSEELSQRCKEWEDWIREMNDDETLKY